MRKRAAPGHGTLFEWSVAMGVKRLYTHGLMLLPAALRAPFAAWADAATATVPAARARAAGTVAVAASAHAANGARSAAGSSMSPCVYSRLTPIATLHSKSVPWPGAARLRMCART